MAIRKGHTVACPFDGCGALFHIWEDWYGQPGDYDVNCSTCNRDFVITVTITYSLDAKLPEAE